MLLDYSTLLKYDSRKMHQVYDTWPSIADDTYAKSTPLDNLEKINHIVFAGMGGSGTIGDIFYSLLSTTKIHVSIVKGYRLPKTIDENTLVVATSVSGNTSETLTVLNSSLEYACQKIAFSSGGTMATFCNQHNITHVQIPLTHSPRSSLPSFLYSTLGTLEPCLPIGKPEINESINELEKLKKVICSENFSPTNPSLQLAESIVSTPLIYYPWGLRAAAIRFKNSLQENSKIHVITENIIEACHNGVVAWETPSNVMPILVQGHDDYYKTKERWIILKKFFNELNINFKEIHSIKGGILSKIMHLIYLLDYCSIYLSVKNKRDPTPVKSIDYIKKSSI